MEGEESTYALCVRDWRSPPVQDVLDRTNHATDASIRAAKSLPYVPALATASRRRAHEVIADLVQAEDTSGQFFEQWVHVAQVLDAAVHKMTGAKEPMADDQLALVAAACYSITGKFHRGHNSRYVLASYQFLAPRERQTDPRQALRAVARMEAVVLERLDWNVCPPNFYTTAALVLLRISALRPQYELEGAWQVTGHLVFHFTLAGALSFSSVLGLIALGLLVTEQVSVEALLAQPDPALADLIELTGIPTGAGSHGSALKDCLLVASLSSAKELHEGLATAAKQFSTLVERDSLLLELRNFNSGSQRNAA